MVTEDYWPEHRCAATDSPPEGELAALKCVLDDARDERPLQTHFGGHPHLLTGLLPMGRGAWCFDRPRLGSEFVPDFLLCTHTSAGMQWCMVELESPARGLLTRGGRPAQKLNEALGQVRDWRAWLRANIAYAQNELGFRGLDAECQAYVVIGRRHAIEQRHASRYRELSDERTTIMTYDRLLDALARGRQPMETPLGQQ
jgi:hypothetical protein